MTKHVHLREQSSAPLFPPAAYLNGFALATLTRGCEACSRAYQEWQQEAVRFTTARLESDREFAGKIMACRDLAQGAKLQGEWATTMMNDYFDEAYRVAELASKIGSDMWAASVPSVPPASARHAHAAD